MQEISPKFKPFRLSPVTRQIEEYMEAMFVGDVVTYQDLKSLTGFTCQSGGRGYCYVNSAMKRLERRGHHYANIPDMGYRKLNANEAVDDRTNKFENAGRQARRHIRAMGTVDYDALGSVERVVYRTTLVCGRLVSRMLSTKVKQKLIEQIKKQPDSPKIDYDALVEVYMRKKGE